MTSRLTKLVIAVAALGAFALGGAALAGAASTGASATAGATGQTAPPLTGARFPAPGSAAHEDSEQAVSGTTAARARSAAVASVGGGSAGAVTTNYDKTGYEVTVTKSDGTAVDVHMDLSFHVDAGHGPSPGPPMAEAGSA